MSIVKTTTVKGYKKEKLAPSSVTGRKHMVTAELPTSCPILELDW